MVEKYYVAIRPQTNEMHSVHKAGCPFLPENVKRIYLGLFQSDRDANLESQHYFTETTNCSFCCKEHKAPEEKFSFLDRSRKELQTIKQQIPVSYHQIMLCCLS